MKTAPKTQKNVKFTERIVKFFKGVWSELKKVHWPTKKEIVTYTSVVLAAVAMVAVLIWVVDSVFSFLLSFILG
ncbi:preprotein translocase subunit SecE [Desulfitibacter alkalitolerans]|uniref:preprotein translocase subunit SecE n=1 Tax=Desulfitibacter alkalitolerans TaxID=264641 RepID=UPI0004876D96|nr:preprotein translocase subunit SecE [Desulfitibacter alkalitolerans]